MNKKQYLTESKNKEITKEIIRLLKSPPKSKDVEPMDVYRWVESIVKKVKQVK